MRQLDHPILYGNLIPIILLVTLVLALFAPYLLHPNWLIYPTSGFSSDLVFSFWPRLTAWANNLADGRLQLWNDSTTSGHPVGMVGDPQAYPFALLSLALPSTAAITVMAAVHVLLGGIFCYYLVRACFSASRLAALVSALSFMLMPKLIAHLASGHLPNVLGLAWMPAVLLGTWSAMQSRRAWPAILAGFALALQLPTHPQILVSTLYLLAGLLGWQWWTVLVRAGWRSREFRETVKWTCTTVSLVGVTAIGLGAIWWLPLLELLPWMSTVEFESSIPFWYQLPPAMLLTLLAPLDLQFPEWMMYLGAAPLFLALIALFGSRRRQALFLWAAVVLSLIIALGNATPVHSLARWLIPGLGLFRTRTRLWFLGAFAVALLAGLGMDALRVPSTWTGIERRQKWFKLGTASYLLASTLVVAGLGIYTRRLPTETIRAAVAGNLFLLVFWLWKRHGRTWLQGSLLVVAILLLDLLPFASEFMTGIDPDDTILRPSPAVQFIAEQPGVFRVYSPHRNMPYAISAALGIDLMHGLSNLQLAHATELIKIASGCRLSGYAGSVPPCLTSEIDPLAYLEAVPEPSLLGLLNVRFVVADFPLTVSDLKPVFVDGEVTVYENNHFLPRSFLAETVETVPKGDDIFERLLETDLERTVLIEAGEQPRTLPAGSIDGTVFIETRESGHMVLDVEANRDALLVYSEAWAPGWRATVNGKPTRVLRVDGALLGLVIPQGYSRVTLKYLPLAWQIGLGISMVSLAVVVLALTASYMRAKHGRSSED